MELREQTIAHPKLMVVDVPTNMTGPMDSSIDNLIGIFFDRPKREKENCMPYHSRCTHKHDWPNGQLY
jgi:hypothetical protein